MPTTPEFFLVLTERELSDELADAVFEAGFGDSELTMRHGQAAIWICHRAGEFTALVKAALHQAQTAGIEVDHVEIDNDVFVKAQ